MQVAGAGPGCSSASVKRSVLPDIRGYQWQLSAECFPMRPGKREYQALGAAFAGKSVLHLSEVKLIRSQLFARLLFHPEYAGRSLRDAQLHLSAQQSPALPVALGRPAL